MQIKLWVGLGAFLVATAARADLVTTFDFSDSSTWDVSVSLFGTTSDHGSGITGSGAGLVVDRVSSGTGGIFLTAVLIGSINTSGFVDLSLSFENENLGSNSLHYDAETSEYGSIGDGFQVISAQGVSFDTADANASFEDVLDDGATWNSTSASLHGQDLLFSSSADNSSITDFVIRMQVNAGGEELELRNFQVHGTASVPEPSAFVFGGLVTFLIILPAIGAKARRLIRAQVCGTEPATV